MPNWLLLCLAVALLIGWYLLAPALMRKLRG